MGMRPGRWDCSTRPAVWLPRRGVWSLAPRGLCSEPASVTHKLCDLGQGLISSVFPFLVCKMGAMT